MFERKLQNGSSGRGGEHNVCLRLVHPGEEICYDSVRVNKVLFWCSFVCVFQISMIPWELVSAGD